MGCRWVEEAAGRAGAENIRVVTKTEKFYITPADLSEAEFHVETRIEIVAVGRPNWRRENNQKILKALDKAACHVINSMI